jgi:hypothetical protein
MLLAARRYPLFYPLMVIHYLWVGGGWCPLTGNESSTRSQSSAWPYRAESSANVGPFFPGPAKLDAWLQFTVAHIGFRPVTRQVQASTTPLGHRRCQHLCCWRITSSLGAGFAAISCIHQCTTNLGSLRLRAAWSSLTTRIWVPYGVDHPFRMYKWRTRSVCFGSLNFLCRDPTIGWETRSC